MGGQRLATVVLRVKHAKGLVHVIGHHAHQLAPGADEVVQAGFLSVLQAGQPVPERLPHLEHWRVVLAVAVRQQVFRLQHGKEHAQRQQPLLAVHHIQPALLLMKNDGTQHVGYVVAASLRIAQVVQQLQGRRGRPAVGALVFGDAQLLRQQRPYADSADPCVFDCHGLSFSLSVLF